jgi:hypothetical protein
MTVSSFIISSTNIESTVSNFEQVQKLRVDRSAADLTNYPSDKYAYSYLHLN